MVESFFRDSLTEDSQSAKKADNMKKKIDGIVLFISRVTSEQVMLLLIINIKVK